MAVASPHGCSCRSASSRRRSVTASAPTSVAHLQQRLDEIRREARTRPGSSTPSRFMCSQTAPRLSTACAGSRATSSALPRTRTAARRCKRSSAASALATAAAAHRFASSGTPSPTATWARSRWYDPDPISSLSGDSSHSSRSRDAVPHSPARSSSSHRWRRSTTTDHGSPRSLGEPQQAGEARSCGGHFSTRD